jgi:2-hydroxy-6-oxonona-2,4-dienedioate hydrolase
MDEKYVDAGGIRTRYLEAGSGDPFVLVHGGEFGRFANANDWEPLIERLAARGFRVLAIDKIGNGFSDHPQREEDLLIGLTVRHIRDFIEALGLKAVHIAGHSRGGFTVTSLALDFPELVKTLVVVSSGTTMARFNPIYEKWNQEAAKINDPRERARYQIASNSFDTAHITESFLDLFVKITDLPQTQKTSRLMVGGARARFLADVAERQKLVCGRIEKGEIKAPTLVMWGLNDPSATFDPVGLSAINLFLPNAPKAEAHVFGRAGHYVYREQPEGFAEVVAGYIARTR